MLCSGSRTKRLVPVLVTPCQMPNILRHVTICDYSRKDISTWFWNRLVKSLQAPLETEHTSFVTGANQSDRALDVDNVRTATDNNKGLILQTSGSYLHDNSTCSDSVVGSLQHKALGHETTSSSCMLSHCAKWRAAGESDMAPPTNSHMRSKKNLKDRLKSVFSTHPTSA